MSTPVTATPEIPLVDVTLESRELLGGASADMARVPDRVSFGRAAPTAVTQDAPGLDDDVRASLGSDLEHRFIALEFTCSFRPGDDPLVEARLVIRLSSQLPDDEIDPPIARSLQPDRLIHPIERHTRYSLMPKVSAASAISVEGIGVTSQDKFDVQECYLVANGKRSSTADWYFRATQAVALEGMHDLRLIAQVRQGVPALAEVMMTAKIRRHAVGLVPYRAALPEQLRTIKLPD
jgi:hypothetical protein